MHKAHIDQLQSITVEDMVLTVDNDKVIETNAKYSALTVSSGRTV